MRQKLNLRRPLLINNVKRESLEYDFEEITCDRFSEAFAYASAKKFIAQQTSGQAVINTMEFDGNVHLYMGIEAILAVNPDIDIKDLEMIKGYDLVTITGLGRVFMLGKSEELSSQSNLGEQSDTIPESTEPASEK